MPCKLSALKIGDMLSGDRGNVKLMITAVDDKGVYGFLDDGTKSYWPNVENLFTLIEKTETKPVYYHIYRREGTPFISHDISILDWELFSKDKNVKEHVFSKQFSSIELPIGFDINKV